MKPTKYADIVILGGGMAGMTAAIYAARAGRACILLESAVTGGLANSSYLIENFPSQAPIHGMELMQKVREQVDSLGVAVEELCDVAGLHLTAALKRIDAEEAVYEAKAVIVATGRKPVPLDVPHACEQVHACAVCDGAPYRGKSVLVVGGGNSAFDEGLYLHRLGVGRMLIVEKEDRFFAAKNARDLLLGNSNVESRLSARVKDLVLDQGRLHAAVLENTVTGMCETVRVDGVFVFLGQMPNSDLFRNTLLLDRDGYIIADECMRTNVDGVFSAGDVNAKKVRQLTTAAADGTIAGLMADTYLSGKI
jgi:thioredoxin reductase (NADPH)